MKTHAFKVTGLCCTVLVVTLISGCKTRENNDTTQGESTVFSLKNPPGPKQGSGFAYGTEADPAYRQYQENKKKNKSSTPR